MNKGAKPLDYYRDQYGIHPVWGWAKIINPGTGWFASKTSWTAIDEWEFIVDWSTTIPTGTKAIKTWFTIIGATYAKVIYWRKYGDPNISSHPLADVEYSTQLTQVSVDTAWAGGQAEIWLSTDYKSQFATSDIAIDLYLSYPFAYLI